MVGVLAAACVATFAVTRLEERKENIKTSGEIVLALEPDSVTAVSWEYGETALAFHKADVWLYDGDEAFPVDEGQINALLEPFTSFGVSFIIEDVTDYSPYGLDDPQCVITLTTAAQTYTVRLGDYSVLDEERYVALDDGRVYLAKVDPLASYDVTLEDMILHDESLSYASVTQLQFSGTEHYTILYDEDSSASPCAEDVYFTQASAPLDTDRVEDYLETLTTLPLTRYVTYNATEEDLASYGLDAPELVIEVEYQVAKSDEIQSYTLSISRDPTELAALKEAEETGEAVKDDTFTAYARVGQSQIVYFLSESDYNALMKAGYANLRHRSVFTADFDQVYQVDVTLEGSQHTLSADGRDEDGQRVWSYGEETVDLSDFQQELTSLSALLPSDFTDATPSGQLEMALTLHLETEAFPQLTIQLYREDGQRCLCLVNGESFAYLSRADVMDLVETIQAIVLS